MDAASDILHLGIALGAGLLIGVERGWKSRALEEGRRVAGIRTFTLIAMLGGLCALLTRTLGWGPLAVGLAGVALAMTVAYRMTRGVETGDVGITSIVAALLAFVLGALAMLGQAALAAVGAVLTTLILGVKPTLHRWLSHLESEELYGALKLLIISVVMLPVLPNRGYGPWQALNPYELWWMVVLIAGISFAGYVAMKRAGPRKGTLLTGLLGGLASSTAVTLSFARLARRSPDLAALLAGGVLLAGGTMSLRILLVAAVVSLSLAGALSLPLLAMTGVTYAGAALLWRSRERAGEAPGARPQLHNPFELGPALGFGLLLAVIMLAARGLEQAFGDPGLYLLAGISGLSDVDAIALSVADMVEDGLAVQVGALAVIIAAAVNTAVKAGLALGIGGRALGLRVGAVSLLAVGAALAVLHLT